MSNLMEGGWSIVVCSDAGIWIIRSIPALLFEWISGGHEVQCADEASPLRSVDNDNYLAWFKLDEQKYILKMVTANEGKITKNLE